MRFLYSLIFILMVPWVLLYFLWRSLREPAYRQRWSERFGYLPEIRTGGIWVHAASVGEVQAARSLVDGLLLQYPQLPLTLSCFTPTGSQRARELWGDRVGHCYLPLDTPLAVRRFVHGLQPRIAIVMETEIWPNLYGACARAGIPMVIASARLTGRSLDRLTRFPGKAVLRESLAGVAAVFAQTQADAERYRQAGAKNVLVSGNLKFDAKVDPAARERAQVLRERWGSVRPVWVAGSTHEGEESQVLQVHSRLRQSWPELLLVLVPRHPQRFSAVAALCTRTGLRIAQRSRGETGDLDTQVVLVDTIGELGLFYAAADIAFVGGSLVPVGGHNLLEPAVLGVPILVGPHMQNQQDITDRLLAAGGVRQVNGVDDMTAAVSECLGSSALRHKAGMAARQVIELNQGALAQVLRQVAEQLKAVEPARA